MLARMLCKLLAFLRGRSIIYQTLYIDLELQTDTSRFHTPRAFARHHRQRLDEAIQRDVPLCICFDNVPFNGSREMQIIKDEVILRALDHNAFLIFVQQDMRGNGLGGDVPRVMAWQLSPFVDEAVTRILQQASDYQVNNDHLQKLVRYAQGHPYLALLMYQSSVDEGIAGFLDYWIQQRNLWNHREQIYTYAHALSLTSPAHIYQMERLLSVCGCAPNQLDEARKLLGPTDLGWWELVSHSEQRYDLYPRWVPVVRAALRYQCEHQKPELYQELSEMTKEA
jgi:hypothetical protein